MGRTLVVVVVCALAGVGGAYFYLVAGRGPAKPSPASRLAVATGICEEHQVEEARCPFCNPSLLASMGECKEHGVPEALCFRCHPELEAAFKTEGDWCAGHGVPESQCEACMGGKLPPGEGPPAGAANRRDAEAGKSGGGGNP